MVSMPVIRRGVSPDADQVLMDDNGDLRVLGWSGIRLLVEPSSERATGSRECRYGHRMGGNSLCDYEVRRRH